MLAVTEQKCSATGFPQASSSETSFGRGDIDQFAVRFDDTRRDLDSTPLWCHMTEKRKPTYDLEAIRHAFRTPSRLATTTTALRTAAALGFDRDGIVRTIQGLERRHFYRSMTSYADSKLWQDVYHAPSPVGTLLRQVRRGYCDGVPAPVLQGERQWMSASARRPERS